MASNPLQISWNNFTGWVNDQKFQWQAGRYYKWYWVDTQRYDVTPTKAPNLIHTYSSWIDCIFNTSKLNWSDHNVIWASDEIYYDETLAYTLTQWENWNKIWYMKPVWSSVIKLYYFNDEIPTIATKYIHRSNLDWSWMSQSYRSFASTAWNVSYIPPAWMIVKSEWERILFSYYNTIWEISNSEVVTKLLDLPEIENVVWITEFQWSYKIYTTVAFSTSKMYTWDWWSEIPETSITLDWLAILWVVNNGAYDYVSANGSLYLFAWVQYQELYKDINPEMFIQVDNQVIIWLNQSNYVLASLWDKPWYSRALTPKQIVDIIDQTEDISAIDYSTDWLVFASYTKLYKNYWTAETGTINAFIESLVFVWDSVLALKELNEIRLKFSWFSTNNIVFYCQIQESWTWIKLFEWNNATISSINHWIRISKNKFLNPIWNFNTIRFKVEFPHNWNPQGKFYWVDVFGNQEIWT